MAVDVVHRPERSQYELVLADGSVIGELDYRDQDGVRTMHHTGVRSAHEGKGHAARLAKRALDDARADAIAVDPVCWFVARYIDRHPEYGSLLAR